jgi:hypothetical protein
MHWFVTVRLHTLMNPYFSNESQTYLFHMWISSDKISICIMNKLSYWWIQSVFMSRSVFSEFWEKLNHDDCIPGSYHTSFPHTRPCIIWFFEDNQKDNSPRFRRWFRAESGHKIVPSFRAGLNIVHNPWSFLKGGILPRRQIEADSTHFQWRDPSRELRLFGDLELGYLDWPIVEEAPVA